MKRTLLSISLALASLTGSAAAAPQAVAPAAVAGLAPQPAILTQSHFGKDPTGAISEADLQKVLESPIDLQFLARIGVVPVAKPFDAEGKVAIADRAVASHDLAAQLIGHPDFEHVSDVTTDLPNAGGLEGLRAIAARYR